MILKYQKIREDVIVPTRSNPSDAGLDLYYNPSRDPGRMSPGVMNYEVTTICLEPGHAAILQTGIKLEVPHGYMFEIKNRSSIASKRKLIVGACVVDAGYSGEIFINLINVGNKRVKLVSGDKIAQGVLVPVVSFRLLEGKVYEDPVCISGRGAGGFGSTDEK